MGEARNREEGVALIEQLTPDIIITDINTPVVDGLRILSQTKEAFGYVTIILTGYPDLEYAREVIRCDITYYVLKPLNMEEIWETLEKAVLEVRNITIIYRQTEGIHRLKNASLLLAPDSREGMNPAVDQVLDPIAANYERRFSLTDLGAEPHYSERYINQYSQKTVGTTVIGYLSRYRIQKTLNLLKEHETLVSDIGWKCSIRGYKYFYYVFKKYIGCSPKGYQAGTKP